MLLNYRYMCVIVLSLFNSPRKTIDTMFKFVYILQTQLLSVCASTTPAHPPSLLCMAPCQSLPLPGLLAFDIPSSIYQTHSMWGPPPILSRTQVLDSCSVVRRFSIFCFIIDDGGVGGGGVLAVVPLFYPRDVVIIYLCRSLLYKFCMWLKQSGVEWVESVMRLGFVGKALRLDDILPEVYGGGTAMPVLAV